MLNKKISDFDFKKYINPEVNKYMIWRKKMFEDVIFTNTIKNHIKIGCCSESQNKEKIANFPLTPVLKSYLYSINALRIVDIDSTKCCKKIKLCYIKIFDNLADNFGLHKLATWYRNFVVRDNKNQKKQYSNIDDHFYDTYLSNKVNKEELISKEDFFKMTKKEKRIKFYNSYKRLGRNINSCFYIYETDAGTAKIYSEMETQNEKIMEKKYFEGEFLYNYNAGISYQYNFEKIPKQKK